MKGKRMQLPTARIGARAVGSTWIALGALPCVLGIATGFGLLLTGTVWLTDTSGVWPIFCVMFSIWLVQAIAQSIRETTTGRHVSTFRRLSLVFYSICIFAFVSWTALYVSLWSQATKIPYTTAIVSDGVVHRISDIYRDSATPVLLMTGSRGKKFVHNVEGRVVVHAMEAQFKFDKPYIATRMNGDDLAGNLIQTLDPILTPLTKQSRTRRVQLLTARGELEQLGKIACLAIMRGTASCPLSLKLTPSKESTARSRLWSTEYTEAEAIAEKHIPSLTQYLADDTLAPTEIDAAFKLLMEAATQNEQFGIVARKSHTISDEQFSILVGRILAAEQGGGEAGVLLMASNRLTATQRTALREKMLHEASIDFIVKNAAKLRLNDSEVAQLSTRMQAAVVRRADVATSILDAFGERLPADVQSSAIEAVTQADVGAVLDTLRALNFSPELRERTVRRLVALVGERQMPNLSKGQLRSGLTPRELEAFATASVPNTTKSRNWLDFVVQTLPVSAMTHAQQKTVVDELMFSSTKAALEYVSENHKHMDSGLVNEVTRDYAKTIDREFCLHLTHRNNNRNVEYFSQDQIKIFADCAHDAR
jgi:hypothetical protein